MSVKLKVKVTKEITRQAMWCGTNGSSPSENCQVALAVRGIFPTAIIGYNRMCIPIHNKSYGINLPGKAKKGIRVFDSLEKTPEKRLDLPEYEFEIDIPDEVIDQLDISDIKEFLKDSKTLEVLETLNH